MAVGMDAATMRLTQQVVDAFRGAGWQLPGTGFTTAFGGPPLLGIVAIVHSAESVPPEVGAVEEALRKTRFLRGPLEVLTDDKLHAGEFNLRIGVRPD